MRNVSHKPSEITPESVSRIIEGGGRKPGKLYFVESVLSSGKLKISHEYSFYHWLESDEWSGDVIALGQWGDLDEGELERALREFGIAE